MLLACDLAEPVLQDVVDAQTPLEIESLVEEACASIEACCGLEAPSCASELTSHVEGVLFAAEYAADLGVEVTRDEACPLLPFEPEIAARCSAEPQCTAPCKPYVGSVEAGGACRGVLDVDDCAQGLLCFSTFAGSTGVREGVCADPCDRVGQACTDDDGLMPTGGKYLFRGSWACGPVAYCSGAGVCASVHAIGGACADGTGCVEGSYCGPEGACVVRLGLDAACSSTAECTDGLLCDEGSGTCRQEWEGLDPEAPLGCAWAEVYGGLAVE